MGMKNARRRAGRPVFGTAGTALQPALLRDKNVVLTGTLATMKRREAATRLAAAGACVDTSISKNTDLLIAGNDVIVPGREPGSKMRKALANRIQIWSEGDLLIALEPERRQLDELFPNSINLGGITPTASGEIALLGVPRKRRVILHWQAVPFRTTRKFAEDWGMEFFDTDAYLGHFTWNGEPLTVPAKGEKFRFCRFKENGSDYWWESREFDGQPGVNVSWLVRALRARGRQMSWSGDTLQLKSQCSFGAVLGFESERYEFDFAARTLRWRHDWGPNDMDK